MQALVRLTMPQTRSTNVSTTLLHAGLFEVDGELCALDVLDAAVAELLVEDALVWVRLAKLEELLGRFGVYLAWRMMAASGCI